MPYIKNISPNDTEWKTAHEELLSIISDMQEEETNSFRIMKEKPSSIEKALPLPNLCYPSQALLKNVTEKAHNIYSTKFMNELSCVIIPVYPKFLSLKDLYTIIETHYGTEMWIIRN